MLRHLVILCLVIVVALPGVTSLQVRSDVVQKFEIVDRNNQRRTVQRRVLLVECGSEDVDETKWTDLQVVETQPNGAPPKTRTVKLQCRRPYIETVSAPLGQIPLWSGDWRQRTDLTFFNQNQTDSEAVYNVPGENGARRRLLSLDDLANETGNPLIQKMSQVPLANRRKLLQLKPAMVISPGGVGLGIDITCVLPSAISSFIGGCSANSPDAALNQIRAELATVTEFARETRDLLYIQQAQWDNQIYVNRQFQDQINLNRDSIESLNTIVPLIWEFQMALSEHMTLGFEQTKRQLQQQAETSSQLLQLTLSLHNATTQQFLSLTRSQQGLGSQLNDLLVTVWQIYSDRGMLRIVTQRLYEDYDTPQVAPFVYANRLWNEPEQVSYPLLRIDPRKAPKPTGFAGTHTREKSTLIADTSIQFSVSDAQGVTGWNYQFKYRCDTEFLLNNYVPSIQLKTLFARFGPPNCAPLLSNAPWLCQCMTEVTVTRCNGQFGTNLGPAPWPWRFGPQSRLKVTDGPNICPNSVVTQDTVLITRQADLSAYLNAQFCQRQSGTIATDPETGKAFRLTAQGKYWNLGPSNGQSAGCLDVFEATAGSNNLANFMYQAWQTSYKSVAQVAIPAKEAEVFGEILTPDDGLQLIDQPWSKDPISGNSGRSVTARFVQPSFLKEEVWAESQLQEMSAIRIQVFDTSGDNPNPIQDFNNIPNGVSANQDWLAIPGETLSTTVNTHWSGQGLLPAHFLRVGEFGGQSVGSNPNAPERIVFDPPESQLSQAQSPVGRCGTLTYLIQMYAWYMNNPERVPDRLTVDEWMRHNLEAIDPSCAREQLAAYMRGLKRVGNRVECDSQISADGIWRPLPLETNLMCTLLRYYEVKQYNPAGEIHHFFYPHTFYMSAWVVIPAGEIRSSYSSLCPTVSITQIAGRAIATVTSPTSFPNMVDYTVRTRGCNPQTDKPPCSKCDVTHKPIVLPPLTGAQVDIGECMGSQLEFNVFTIDAPSEPCFVPWVDVSSTANRSIDLVTSGALNDLVTQRFNSQADQIAISIGQQVNRNFEWNARLEYIAATYTSQNDLIRRVEEAVRQNMIDAGKFIVPNQTEYARRIDQIVKNETKRISDNIINGRNMSANTQTRIAQMEALQNKSAAILAGLNLTVERLTQQQAALDRIMDEYNAQQRLPKKCDGIFGNIPIVGQLTCMITDAFNGILNWLTPDTTWLWWIIGILVFLCCCGSFCLFMVKFGGTCIHWCKTPGAAQDSFQRFGNAATGNQVFSTPSMSIEDILLLRSALDVLSEEHLGGNPQTKAKFRERLQASGLLPIVGGLGRVSGAGPEGVPNVRPTLPTASGSGYQRLPTIHLSTD